MQQNKICWRKVNACFFPNGQSSQGKADEFQFDVWDYQDQSMDESTTIGQLYKDTKMSMLRFYLASDESDRDISDKQVDEDTETESLPELSFPKRRSPNTDFPSVSDDLLTQAIQIAGIETDDIDGNFATAQLENSDQVDDFNSAISETMTENSQTTAVTEHILILHRGQVMKEMIDAFGKMEYPLHSIVRPQMIMPNGEMEAAEDAGGVTRDVLAEFWNSFYTECTLGNLHKVPYLRHDFGEREWKSVAKIIVFGWKTVKYFPIQISPIFLQYCIYGSYQNDILDEFMQYIPHNDAVTLKAALVDVSSVDQTELDEIFTQHELRRVPRQANMERICREMAHKELIQTPMFVIDCWGPILRELQLPLEDLITLYRNLIPTPRRVINLLKFPEHMCEDATVTSHHLKRFIREMDSDHLTRFLRFCTGADLLIENCIEISFVDVVGFARRPVAHTCSSLLELPKKYENFLQFRTEVLSVLNSNIWVMDII